MKRKIAIILVLLVCCSFIFCVSSIVFAAEMTAVAGATDVLEDLQRDEDFNAGEWAYNNQDYSLQVITIAEGKDNALYVYVYQPNLVVEPLATSLNMSVQKLDDNTKKYLNYDLTFLNRNSVFVKYVVQNFFVPGQARRSYEISSIFRNFIDGVDSAPSGGNVVNEVAFPAQGYKDSTPFGGVWTFDNSLGLIFNDLEVIEIESQFVGFARYDGGLKLFGGTDLDSHFIAFSTNRKIDELLEADVTFVYQTCSTTVYMGQSREDFGTPTKDYAYLDYSQSEAWTGGGWWASTYTWERIQTVNEFINSINSEKVFSCGVFDVTDEKKISQENLSELLDKQWVLRFVETDYSMQAYVNGGYISKTIVSEVSILRLYFKSNGKFYNLGTVSDKQTGSGEPINETDISVSISRSLEIKFLSLALSIFLVFAICFLVLSTVRYVFKKIRKKK